MLLDRFLNDAIEVDVDAMCDGTDVLIGGIMEHIEQAGRALGRLGLFVAAVTLEPKTANELRAQTVQMAKALNVVGLMNVQFAIQGGTVYVLEVNPRASRTVPSCPRRPACRWRKSRRAAWRARRWSEQGVEHEVIPPYYSVKEAVFPFIKFPGVDTILGPEMKSTGEVMGVAHSFGEAFVKSQLAAGVKLPKAGKVFISVKPLDKPRVVEVARALLELGLLLCATRGTANPWSPRRAGADREQSAGRPAAYRGHDQEQRNCTHHQHGGRQARDPRFIMRLRAAAEQFRVTYYTTLAGRARR